MVISFLYPMQNSQVQSIEHNIQVIENGVITVFYNIRNHYVF